MLSLFILLCKSVSDSPVKDQVVQNTIQQISYSLQYKSCWMDVLQKKIKREGSLKTLWSQ